MEGPPKQGAGPSQPGPLSASGAADKLVGRRPYHPTRQASRTSLPRGLGGAGATASSRVRPGREDARGPSALSACRSTRVSLGTVQSRPCDGPAASDPRRAPGVWSQADWRDYGSYFVFSCDWG